MRVITPRGLANYLSLGCHMRAIRVYTRRKVGHQGIIYIML